MTMVWLVIFDQKVKKYIKKSVALIIVDSQEV